MCGITTILAKSLTRIQTPPQTTDDDNTLTSSIFNIQHVKQTLTRRGPDSNSQINVELGSGMTLLLLSSLLQLRGEYKACCPLIDTNGNVLLFNGEIYGGLEMHPKENDGEVLLNTLSNSNSNEDLIDVLKKLMGPWSLIYWKLANKELWFGRDRLGRRSLLLAQHNEHFMLSSVSFPNSTDIVWNELHPGIYKLPLLAIDSQAIWQTIHEWKKEHISRTLVFDTLSEAVDAFMSRFRISIQDRCPLNYEHKNSSPVLVLFSGGVDSTLIAAVLHLVLSPATPIDLCNVSFDGNLAPDRISAIDSFLELKKWAPDREWKLILVDSSLSEVKELESHLVQLLHPCDTIMDLNIGASFWLAAKAEGRLYISDNNTYRSEARIVFVGHGADEQCVGYSRHRTKYREGGFESLEEELNLEMTRLWKRNLGRDDRLISDHGREARFPFLDESLVRFVAQLPMEYLFNPLQPRGVGEKIILRECLRQLGLGALSKQYKRAIQFGTHIGKLSNQQRFGSNRAANKSHAGSLSLLESQNINNNQ